MVLVLYTSRIKQASYSDRCCPRGAFGSGKKIDLCRCRDGMPTLNRLDFRFLPHFSVMDAWTLHRLTLVHGKLQAGCHFGNVVHFFKCHVESSWCDGVNSHRGPQKYWCPVRRVFGDCAQEPIAVMSDGGCRDASNGQGKQNKVGWCNVRCFKWLILHLTCILPWLRAQLLTSSSREVFCDLLLEPAQSMYANSCPCSHDLD